MRTAPGGGEPRTTWVPFDERGLFSHTFRETLISVTVMAGSEVYRVDARPARGQSGGPDRPEGDRLARSIDDASHAGARGRRKAAGRGQGGHVLRPASGGSRGRARVPGVETISHPVALDSDVEWLLPHELQGVHFLVERPAGSGARNRMAQRATAPLRSIHVGGVANRTDHGMTTGHRASSSRRALRAHCTIPWALAAFWGRSWACTVERLPPRRDVGSAVVGRQWHVRHIYLPGAPSSRPGPPAPGLTPDHPYSSLRPRTPASRLTTHVVRSPDTALTARPRPAPPRNLPQLSLPEAVRAPLRVRSSTASAGCAAPGTRPAGVQMRTLNR